MTIVNDLEPHDHSVGGVILASRKAELVAEGASYPDEYIRRVFADVKNMAVRLTQTSGGTNTIAWGMGLDTTDDGFLVTVQFKQDMVAVFGEDFAASALLSPKHLSADPFDAWLLTLLTPLYRTDTGV